MSGPLSADEIQRLPDRLRRRYWAGEISYGVSGLSNIDRDHARAECRAWLAWVDGLRPGARARYVGVCAALAGVCEVAAAWRGSGEALFSITSSKFSDRFLVGSTDLAPAE